MKPNDKAIKAALRATSNSCSAYQIQNALDAAYAAQFPPSEDYAGLITELRMGWATKEKNNRAADALEVVLAERDALKDELALRDACKNGDGQFTLENTFQSLLDMIDLNVETSHEKIAAIEERDAAIKERDELLARLAPVDDEALVEIVAGAINDGSKNIARAAIAAIRPHIEAAERERCARIADKYEGEWHSDTADACARAIATAIRSGK